MLKSTSLTIIYQTVEWYAIFPEMTEVPTALQKAFNTCGRIVDTLRDSVVRDFME